MLRLMTETAEMPAERPRLRRSASDRRVGGVCAGVAAHLGIDAVIVRVVTVVSVLFGAPVVLPLYLVLWLLLPADGPVVEHIELPTVGLVVLSVLAIFVVTGGVALLSVGSVEVLVVLMLVAVGVAVLIGSTRGARPRGAPAMATGVLDPPVAAQPDDDRHEPRVRAWWHAAPPARRRRAPSLLARGTTGIALIAVAGAVLAGTPAREAVATGLLVTAAGLLVGSVYGRGRPLIALAVLFALALGATHFATLPEATPTYGTYLRPAGLRDVADRDTGVGAVTLDLTGVEAGSADTGVHRTLLVGSGHIVVIVPSSLDLRWTATVGVGTLTAFDEEDRGVALRSAGGADGSEDLSLEIVVGVGRVEIRRAIS
jgi:phage shock protein PspC (stress-responsive transcriptional regulator)